MLWVLLWLRIFGPMTEGACSALAVTYPVVDYCGCFMWILEVPGRSACPALAEAEATMPEPDVTFLELLLVFKQLLTATAPVLPLWLIDLMPRKLPFPARG